MKTTKDDMAVIANHEGTGIVLWFYGRGITADIGDIGSRETSNLRLDDGPNGINIWEGKFEWHPGNYECPEDGHYEPNGVFRPPTKLEWDSIKVGKSPWGEDTQDPQEDHEDPQNEDKADINED
jgi:hypothetical protein